MGKVLILYHSASGNTGKMAALVAEGAGRIPGIEVRVRTVDAATPDDVYWCDGLAVGSPTNMGVLSWQMKKFWDETMFSHWGKWTARWRARSRRPAGGAAGRKSPASRSRWC